MLTGARNWFLFELLNSAVIDIVPPSDEVRVINDNTQETRIVNATTLEERIT